MKIRSFHALRIRGLRMRATRVQESRVEVLMRGMVNAPCVLRVRAVACPERSRMYYRRQNVIGITSIARIIECTYAVHVN